MLIIEEAKDEAKSKVLSWGPQNWSLSHSPKWTQSAVQKTLPLWPSML